MQSFKMLKTSDVKHWVRHMNTTLQQKRIRDPQDLKMWELDVREMFLRLPRGNIDHVSHRPPPQGGKWQPDWGV